MPRDKSTSHEKIIKAAMQEFSTKGFEQASMKAIADEVGMSSAALYRHFVNKQDMFASLVQPALDALEAWEKSHIASSYEAMEHKQTEPMWDFEENMNDGHMVLDVMYQYPEQFFLLICRSAGTPYENFVHEMADQAAKRMMHFLQDCKANGAAVQEIQEDEMHMLVSAYFAALLQPIEHGYTKSDAMRYLKTIIEFFSPGWRKITGL